MSGLSTILSRIQCLLQDIHATVICTYFYRYFAWGTRNRPSKKNDKEGLVNGLEWKCTLHPICRHTSEDVHLLEMLTATRAVIVF